MAASMTAAGARIHAAMSGHLTRGGLLLRFLEVPPELLVVGVDLLLERLLGACERLAKLLLKSRLHDPYQVLILLPPSAPGATWRRRARCRAEGARRRHQPGPRPPPPR